MTELFRVMTTLGGKWEMELGDYTDVDNAKEAVAHLREKFPYREFNWYPVKPVTMLNPPLYAIESALRVSDGMCVKKFARGC